MIPGLFSYQRKMATYLFPAAIQIHFQEIKEQMNMMLVNEKLFIILKD